MESSEIETNRGTAFPWACNDGLDAAWTIEEVDALNAVAPEECRNPTEISISKS
jgi:hypothetical protein